MPKNLDDIKDILSLAIRLQNLCEGFDTTNKSAVITSKIKILLELSKKPATTPSALRERIGLAKSNITIICNNLIAEQLIQKSRDNIDTREIYYGLTQKGSEFLERFLSTAKKNFASELAYKNNIKKINEAVKELLKLVD